MNDVYTASSGKYTLPVMHTISIILCLTSIVTGIRLYPEAGTLHDFLFTGCKTFHTNHGFNAGILVNGHLSLSRNVTFQAFHNVLCLCTGASQNKQQDK